MSTGRTLHGGHPVLEHMVAVPATRTGLWVAVQRATRSRYMAERVPSAGATRARSRILPLIGDIGGESAPPFSVAMVARAQFRQGICVAPYDREHSARGPGGTI